RGRPVTTKQRAHSSEYFGAERNFFWNRDYIGLVAARLALKKVRCALDVGCGRGHWSAVLLPWLSDDLRLTGVDHEEEHVAHYKAVMSTALRAGASGALRASAERLPFPDNHFGLSTCQTLLMHVKEPQAVMNEMARVVEPGGIVLCAEPNNVVARLPLGGTLMEQDPNELVLVAELAMRVAIGKERRGLGSEAVGERLPALMQNAGLFDVQVWISDKAFVDLPPYDSDEERARLSTARTHQEEGIGAFDEADARADFLASGGSPAQFARCWSAFEASWHEAERGRRHGTWRAAGGGLMYLVAGRKPSSEASSA
ncbi:class I SAM-dependent methyltransferase, partial [Streptococcus pyogenes]|uniref:class I SAM-dependent methyltransferase n=1 Tax=Streptococcus pyogenes TaxID=1314 RepID=UPI003D9FD608